MKEKIVVALGGNAILTDDPTAEGQIRVLRETSKELVKLIEAGYEIIITHGNGPQVGNLLLQQDASDSPENPAMPLDTAVAMTQGSIGYWLENALKEELSKAGVVKRVATILTQVEVSPDDPAFQNPTKPIGPFLSQAEAEKREAETGDKYAEDAGRGYRKVVPSPKPVSIVEARTISLVAGDDTIAIAAGGGGIPVVKEEGYYRGVDAVIDKDFAAAKLAELTQADYLVILTGVDNVYINFNKPNQEKLETVTVDKMKQYIAEEQFAAGSMLPKIEAALEFLESKKDGKAYITSLENVDSIVHGGSATVIVN
ncbi:MAG: carbamate kinase [Clostridiaceae bacterium]|nr:carbamate kinase [Clostridiaceae bacterium]